MKMFKLNKMTNTATILFISIIAIFTLIFCNIDKSYADEDSYTSNSETFNGTKNRDYDTNLTYEEIEAENDRVWRTDEWYKEEGTYKEGEGSEKWENCYGQPQNNWLPALTNTIHTYIDGEDYPFDYNVTGFYGDEENSLDRKAYVQFFYNSDTKVLRILCFGDGEKGFNTYNYHSGTTVLEDEPEIYCERGLWWCLQKFHISQECKYIELDPKLEKIMRGGFKNMPHLESVDIIGQEYCLSKLNTIQDYAFENCGKNNSNNGIVKMHILRVKGIKCEYDWDKDTKVEVEPFVPPVYNVYGKVQIYNPAIKTFIPVYQPANVEFVEDDGTIHKTITNSQDAFVIENIPEGTKGRLYCTGSNFSGSTNEITVRKHNDVVINTYKYKKIAGEVHILNPDGKGFTKAYNLNVDFIEENGTVHHTDINKYSGLFQFELPKGINGIFHVKSIGIEGYLDYKVTNDTDKIIINAHRIMYKINGVAHLIDPNGQAHQLMKAKVDFIEKDSGIKHETVLDNHDGIFYFDLAGLTKGTFYVHTDDGEIEGSLDYTVVSDDGNIDIDCRYKHQKYTYNLSGTVIYGDMSTCEAINVDLICDTGKVIHKEYWPSHMSDQINFNFDNIEFGSNVKIHVYIKNGISKQTEQFTVNSNMQLNPINIS